MCQDPRCGDYNAFDQSAVVFLRCSFRIVFSVLDLLVYSVQQDLVKFDQGRYFGYAAGTMSGEEKSGHHLCKRANLRLRKLLVFQYGRECHHAVVSQSGNVM